MLKTLVQQKKPTHKILRIPKSLKSVRTIIIQIHLTGWSKTFTATYEERNSAVATEEAIGSVEWNGQTVYAYKDTMTAQGQDTIGTPITTGWDTTVYVSCGFEGQEGMFMVGWEGTASQCSLCFFAPTTYAVDATLSPYRRYLSPEFAVNGEVGIMITA